MEDKMIANILEKTGKSVDQWIEVVKGTKLSKHGEIIKFLKSDHGFTHGYANYVAHKARKSDAGSHDNADLIAGQYSGKESLRPIYDRLISEIAHFGDDVEIAPKKAYVSLRRKKQFALIQPSTKTRVDVGVVLKGREPEGPLEAAGSWNTMVSHRVRLSSIDDVNSDVINWLSEAYDSAG